MNGEELRGILKSEGIVYGTMLGLCHNPRWAGVLGGLGFDCVIIDNEHTAYSRGEVADIAWALSRAGIVPIVRVPIPESHYVTMALDGGAQGILAPYCETVDQVKEVIGAARWRPLKGALLSKAMDTGEFPSQDVRQQLEKANSGNVVMIGIESVPALENLEKILEVDGIDVIFVGPNDMSTSMGIAGQYTHPDFEAMLDQVISKCKAYQVAVAVHTFDTKLTTKWMKRGMRFVLHGMDTRAIQEGFRREFGRLRTLGKGLERIKEVRNA